LFKEPPGLLLEAKGPTKPKAKWMRTKAAFFRRFFNITLPQVCQ